MRVFLILPILILTSCGNVATNSVAVTTYPEIEELLSSQILLIDGNQLEKEVTLDGETESRKLIPDSASWARELAFLKEINPNQSGYVGAFDEIRDGNSVVLKLKEDEKGSLTDFSIIPTDSLVSITSTIHENKDVYVHHKEVVVSFFNEKIKDYQVTGYQKILLKDTIRFEIKGIIVD